MMDDFDEVPENVQLFKNISPGEKGSLKKLKNSLHYL